MDKTSTQTAAQTDKKPISLSANRLFYISGVSYVPYTEQEVEKNNADTGKKYIYRPPKLKQFAVDLAFDDLLHKDSLTEAELPSELNKAIQNLCMTNSLRTDSLAYEVLVDRDYEVNQTSLNQAILPLKIYLRANERLGSVHAGSRINKDMRIQFTSDLLAINRLGLNESIDIHYAQSALDADDTTISAAINLPNIIKSGSLHQLRYDLGSEDRSYYLNYTFTRRSLQPKLPAIEDPRYSKRFYTTPSLHNLSLCGPTSTKSSLTYTYTKGTLNNSNLPFKGHFTKSYVELAGVGGDQHFVKMGTNFKYYKPINQTFSFGFSYKSGFLVPLSKNPIFLTDKLFLGSQDDVRGMINKTIGPMQECDATGGTTLLALGASLLFKIPYFESVQDSLLGQFFINAGSNADLPATANPVTSLKTLAKDARITAGIGITFASPLGRLEINYCHPLRIFKQDVTTTLQLNVNCEL